MGEAFVGSLFIAIDIVARNYCSLAAVRIGALALCIVGTKEAEDTSLGSQNSGGVDTRRAARGQITRHERERA
jgi:hypothetical protein